MIWKIISTILCVILINTFCCYCGGCGICKACKDKSSNCCKRQQKPDFKNQDEDFNSEHSSSSEGDKGLTNTQELAQLDYPNRDVTKITKNTQAKSAPPDLNDSSKGLLKNKPNINVSGKEKKQKNVELAIRINDE